MSEYYKKMPLRGYNFDVGLYPIILRFDAGKDYYSCPNIEKKCLVYPYYKLEEASTEAVKDPKISYPFTL